MSDERTSANRPPHGSRSGMVTVWTTLMLTLLLGVLGLVIDGGLLFAAHRRAYNAADAAALAYAQDRLVGQPPATATATGVTFVQQHNAMPAATLVCNEPPTLGPHAGMASHVETYVTYPVRTLFVHFLGVNPNQQVTGRAVATWSELRTAGEGAIVLDPRVKEGSPGLAVAGGGRLVVRGGVIDNNEGEGIDENSNPVDTNGDGDNNDAVAATGGQPNSPDGIYTDSLRVVGGVDDPSLIKNIDTGTDVPNVLHARSLPVPDPLASLDAPYVGNGVVDTGEWPDVRVSTTGGGDTNINVVPNGATTVSLVDNVAVLTPNVYKQITINGGNVRFEPGIYVISAGGNNGLSITGGDVLGEGVMFYNTGANYDSSTGMPDAGDPYDPLGQDPAPSPNQSGTQFGDVTINASLVLTPIDTDTYPYSGMPAAIETFNGMLFYQRRMNGRTVGIQGDGANTFLGGTIYAKWARFKLQGTAQYDAQFIVGSMDVQGGADITLNYSGQGRGKAPAVFLVE